MFKIKQEKQVMMLQDRIDYFDYIFELLQNTNSRNEKEYIVRDIPYDYKEDFDYIIECLTGKHKFGYTYYNTTPIVDTTMCNSTVKEVLIMLQSPMIEHNLTSANIKRYIERTTAWYFFFEPIVNRTLKLGIGQSLLSKDELSPMLAKKFDGTVKFDKNGYYVTEKLDGNRCIARFTNGKWKFTSRNGKEMHVNFDMSGLDEAFVYDGEVLSPEQVKMSIAIEAKVKNGVESKVKFDDYFSSTSGLINKHSEDKNLVYNVFDIMCDASYKERREELDKMKPCTNEVRILPVLKHCKSSSEVSELVDILDDVTGLGGEGVMINLGSSDYIHKRTDSLLKFKKVYTLDMKVYSVEYGEGKYEGLIGSLKAEIITNDGKCISCSVGTGLSDEQRLEWAKDTSKIVGKTIEVSYFSLSQTKEDREEGNNVYSLRFPRLKRVRYDKDETSEF